MACDPQDSWNDSFKYKSVFCLNTLQERHKKGALQSLTPCVVPTIASGVFELGFILFTTFTPSNLLCSVLSSLLSALVPGFCLLSPSALEFLRVQVETRPMHSCMHAAQGPCGGGAGATENLDTGSASGGLSTTSLVVTQKDKLSVSS